MTAAHKEGGSLFSRSTENGPRPFHTRRRVRRRSARPSHSESLCPKVGGINGRMIERGGSVYTDHNPTRWP